MKRILFLSLAFILWAGLVQAQNIQPPGGVSRTQSSATESRSAEAVIGGTQYVATLADYTAALANSNIQYIVLLQPITLTAPSTHSKPVYQVPGAMITYSSTNTLIIKADAPHGPWQRFVGSSGIRFADQATPGVLPEWFGAKGDSNGTTGDGADDAAAWQTLLSSLAGGQKIIAARGKIYRLTGAIHLSANNIELTGGGTLFFDATSFSPFVNSYPAAFTVATLGDNSANQNGSINLNRIGTIIDRFTMCDVKLLSIATCAGGYLSNAKGLYFVNINKVVQENCWIEGFGGEVNGTAGVDEAWFVGNTYKNCAFNGVSGFASRAIHIKNNTFDTVGQLIEIDGLFLEITGNIALNTGGPVDGTYGPKSGIIVGGSTFNELSKVIIEGNYLHLNPTYDGVDGSAVKIYGIFSWSPPTDSQIHTASIRNNTIDGGWSSGISVFAPPSATGTEVVEGNTIRMISSGPNLGQAIYVYWNSSGYNANAFTEIYNNTIFHADGKAANSIDISGAGLTAPPAVKLIGNKIQTTTALRSENDNSTIQYGGVINVGYNIGNQIVRNNYVNGNRVGVRSVLGVAAGTTNATTSGYAKTVNGIRYQFDSHTYSKAATDNLWNLTGVSTTSSQYLKVLLCLDHNGIPHIVVGNPAASQVAASMPQTGLYQDWVPISVVEIPANYSGMNLLGFVFYDILGEW